MDYALNWIKSEICWSITLSQNDPKWNGKERVKGESEVRWGEAVNLIDFQNVRDKEGGWGCQGRPLLIPLLFL